MSNKYVKSRIIPDEIKMILLAVDLFIWASFKLEKSPVIEQTNGKIRK